MIKKIIFKEMMNQLIIILSIFSLGFGWYRNDMGVGDINTLMNYYNKGDLNEEDIKPFQNLEKTKFESFKINNIGSIYNTSMIIERTGKYKITCEKAMAWIYDKEGKLISNFKENDKIYLLSNSIIYAGFLLLETSEILNVNIEYLYLNNLPFDPINIKKESEFDTSSVKYDPLKYSEINYKKREGKYVYINSKLF